jgi:hypothetical protein
MYNGRLTLKDYHIYKECDGYYVVIRLGKPNRNVAYPGITRKYEAIKVAKEDRDEVNYRYNEDKRRQ